MAEISEAPWDGSASNYDTPEAYCKACLIVNEHDGPLTKSDCSMPIYTPEGALSRAGVHAAAARLNQVQASPDLKKKAAGALLRAYGTLKEQAPAVVYRIAGKPVPAKKQA